MKGIFGSVACLAVVALTVVSLRAAAGVTINQRITSNGTTENVQVQLTRDKMRAELGSAGGGGKQVVIFDATRSVISIVSVDRRTYIEMTKAQIDQLAGQLQGAMAQMETMMAGMPPAQRAQMEAMMRGRGMGGAPAAPPRTVYVKTGADRVGQWACDKYEGTQNGQKVSELCTVPPAAIGLTAADTAVMQQLGELFKGLTSMASQLAPSSMIDIGRMEQQGYSGLPIRSVTMGAGGTTTSELVDLTRGDVPDSQFQVPAGFQKQDMMGGMMGGMGGRGRQ